MLPPKWMLSQPFYYRFKSVVDCDFSLINCNLNELNTKFKINVFLENVFSFCQRQLDVSSETLHNSICKSIKLNFNLSKKRKEKKNVPCKSSQLIPSSNFWSIFITSSSFSSSFFLFMFDNQLAGQFRFNPFIALFHRIGHTRSILLKWFVRIDSIEIVRRIWLGSNVTLCPSSSTSIDFGLLQNSQVLKVIRRTTCFRSLCATRHVETVAW